MFTGLPMRQEHQQRRESEQRCLLQQQPSSATSVTHTNRQRGLHPPTSFLASCQLQNNRWSSLRRDSCFSCASSSKPRLSTSTASTRGHLLLAAVAERTNRNQWCWPHPFDFVFYRGTPPDSPQLPGQPQPSPLRTPSSCRVGKVGCERETSEGGGLTPRARGSRGPRKVKIGACNVPPPNVFGTRFFITRPPTFVWCRRRCQLSITI